MPLYRYEALDRTGNKVVGAMQVTDEQALTARLAAMGYQPTLVEIPTGRAPRASASAAPTLMGAPVPASAAPTSNLATNERAVARMFHQLHQAFKAGMPAFQALTTVQGQVHDRALQAALEEMSGVVRDGGMISTGMERFPRLFSCGDVGILRAAEQGAFLPEAFRSLAERYEQDDNARRRLRIWVWFFHSNVVTLLLFIALSFFFKAAIEAGFDVRAGLHAVGHGFLTISLPAIVVYFGFLFWFYRARRNPRLAHRWHRILLRLPVVGKINFLRANAIFTRTLEQLYRAGVVPAAAWDAAAGAVPNLPLAERFAAGTPVVESTAKFSVAMQQVGVLDVTDVGMVATGESTGEVDQALQYLANQYEEDARVALGAGVVRGAITFVLWAFLVGALGSVAFAQGYYGRIFSAVDKAMGVGE